MMEILWSGRRGRSGNGSHRCFATCVGIAAGLFLATTAYAVDFIINPVGNDSKDVWGLGETIRYEAVCSLLTCTDASHKCQFTDTQGLSGGTGSSGCHVIRVEGVKTSPDTFASLWAKCPDDSSHGTATKTFKVVDIDYLSVDSVQKTNEATVYVEKADSGNVTIDATLTPSATAGELRDDFMIWTGGGRKERPDSSGWFRKPPHVRPPSRARPGTAALRGA